MQTTIEAPGISIGEVLHIKQDDFNVQKRQAEKILPFIQNVIVAYSALNLKDPFDQQFLDGIVNGNRMEKVAEDFRNSVLKEYKGFTNPITKNELTGKIEQYLEQTYSSVRALKKAITDHNALWAYKISVKDFEIKDGQAFLVTESMQEHFTTRVTSENQIEVYELLCTLGEAYNSVAAQIEDLRIKIPLGNSVFEMFFSREVLNGKTWNGGDQYGNKIFVRREQLAAIK